MAKDPLAKAGFYFDELNKLRVLEPDVSQRTSELKEECKEFVDSTQRTSCQLHNFHLRIGSGMYIYVYIFFVSFLEIGQFQKIVGGLMELMDELSKEVETEKMKVSPQQ